MSRDAAQMAALHARAFAQGGAWSLSDFQDLLETRNMVICDNPYGFAVLRIVAPEAEILTIAIAPEMQGKGHGRALLDAVLAQARSARVEDIFLEVDSNNHAARALYAAAGFDETGLRKNYYRYNTGGYGDAILLAKTLFY